MALLLLADSELSPAALPLVVDYVNSCLSDPGAHLFWGWFWDSS
jgi:hypothetical protein